MYKESAKQNCFWRVKIKWRGRVDKENRIVSYTITKS